MQIDPTIIVALDYDNHEDALHMAQRLDPRRCRIKVGKELFVAAGPELIRTLHDLGFEIFLDLKFHDIPNTVAKAVLAAAKLGVWMVNVHASGGSEMMRTTVNSLRTAGGNQPVLIAVTVLTSLHAVDLRETAIHQTPTERVLHLAQLTKHSGFAGVVCSAQEAQLLKQQLGQDFILVTPGIRPAFANVDDQKRIMTPADAVQAGSDYLVIGRPITQAANPMQALTLIEAELQTVQ